MSFRFITFVHIYDEQQVIKSIVSDLMELEDEMEDDLIEALGKISVGLLSVNARTNPSYSYNEDDIVEYHINIHYNEQTLYEMVSRSITMYIEPLTIRNLH